MLRVLFSRLRLFVALVIFLPCVYCASLAQAQDKHTVNGCKALEDRQTYHKDPSFEDFAMMIGGTDGWFFRSRLDLKFRFRLTQRTLDSFRRLNEAFKSHGTTLVLMMMPTRGIVHSEELLPPYSESYDQQEAKKNYLAMLKELRRLEIPVANMIDADAVNFFHKRDNHWTVDGAKFAAIKTADAIKKLAIYKGLKKTMYRTTAANNEDTSIEFPDRYGEFITQICGTPIPHEPLKTIYQTEAADSKITESALLGDAPKPEIALIGTSNSTPVKPSYANFEGFLKEFLSADIYNAAISGGALQGSIGNFLLTNAYKEVSPKVIIWEISAHYGYNSQDFYREIIPAVYGACSDSDAIATFSGTVEPDETTIFSALAPKGLKTHKFYVVVELSDREQRNVKIKFTHSDSRTNTVKLQRSKRNYPENPMIFFAELSDVMESPLDQVSVKLKNGNGTVKAKICETQQ